MKNIIAYKEIEGFYDLRDFEIPKKEFIKLWNIQNYLYHVEKNKEYFKEYNKIQFEKAKELSAKYQNILLKYKIKEGKKYG